MKRGGAKAILSTVTSAEAMNSVQRSLAVNGTSMVFGAFDALAVDALQQLRGRRSISGTSIDSASAPRRSRRENNDVGVVCWMA
jgi:D-arabinose 1-dehydrogenase-like Zn-dependent alcohol dehydrogenase